MTETSAKIPLVARGLAADAEALLMEALPRHRHALSRDAVRASQAARILVATAEVVAANGYAGTTAKAIARRAGVSQKTFYELFDNKEQAFLAAYAGVDLVIERTRAAAAKHAEPRAMLAAGIRTYLEILDAEPAFSRMLVIEAVGAGPRVLARRARGFDAFVSALELPLALARASDPTLPEPDRDLLLTVIGGVNEVVLQRLVAGDPAPLVDLLPLAMELIERAFLRPV